MNKLKVCTINLILTICSICAIAQEGGKEKKKYEFEKRKTYEKMYDLSSGDKVKVGNIFGDIKVTIWDKSEVKVKGELIVTAKTEEWANKVIDNLKITDSKSNGKISFQFENDSKIYQNKGSSQTMETNLEVFVPANTTLQLTNSFGDITLPDYSGSIDVENKFGNLIAGKLTNVEELSVEFGKASIESLANANATFKFSKIEIKNLIGANKLNYEFCNKSTLLLSNSATTTNITESYSTLNIKPSADFTAAYDIRTSFGSLKNKTNIDFKRADEESKYADNDKEYEAQVGNSSNKVKIKSSFGKIIFGEATAEEMEDKKKKGSKNNMDEE
jgi:formylmethanofuran dehydrogenase subunit D